MATYFFMGWNRDESNAPANPLPPLPQTPWAHAWQEMHSSLMMRDMDHRIMEAFRYTSDLPQACVRSPEEINQIQRAATLARDRNRLKESAANRHGIIVVEGRSFLSMGCVKDDDSTLPDCCQGMEHAQPGQVYWTPRTSPK